MLSSTGHILEQMELYGIGPIPRENDPLIQTHAAEMAPALLHHLFDMLDGSPMECYLESISWSLVNIFHRQTTRIDQDLRETQGEIQSLIKQQDGSEIKSVELEHAQARAESAGDHLECMNDIKAELVDCYAHLTGSSWKPKTGSRKSTSKLTASLIDAKDFMRVRKEKEAQDLNPDGPIIGFSGGADWTDTDHIFKTLDKVKNNNPDMILAHTALDRGADKIASRWAECRGVHQIACKPDFKTHMKAAPFKRNDVMIAMGLKGVVLFPGNGITQNLGQKAEKAGVSVLRCKDRAA